jgi:MYXO-CTERM domain-containing protein
MWEKIPGSKRVALVQDVAPVLAAWIVVASSLTPVIGGEDAGDRWPDAVGVVYDGDAIHCSGTLIAPTLVLTAGHCNAASLTHVWIGSSSRSDLGDGEEIAVVERIEYPDSWHTFDVTVLRLARPSAFRPRPIASGWMSFEIVDGAAIELVGFGAIDPEGTRTVDALQEAATTITDARCVRSAGCNVAASPAGELGAGGAGVDTCPGDSGGPLYLVTDAGTFLAGVTSRGYRTNTVPCSEGGIYTRPDAIVDWIEGETGVTLPHAPGPFLDGMTIVADDPRSDAHTFEIVAGQATIDASGRITDWDGDALGVRVTDAGDPRRALEVTVSLGDEGGCGCSGGAASGGAAPLALGALALRRRRRPA